jgi:hypothetical protein
MLNRRRWFVRWPVKWAIFGLAYLVVCFPYPRLLVAHLRHWSDPNALIEPHAPALQPWVADLRELWNPQMPPRKTLALVERFVYERVPYDWDWNTWGMVDYLPTVDEVIRMGREDCDGRAVIAASLLRNLGIDARLVTDFAHVWVSTPAGQTMGPGKVKTVEVAEDGVRFDPSGLLQIPLAFGYGIAVFPLSRELILLVVFWGLLLGAGGWPRTALCLGLLVAGLLLVRHGGENLGRPKLALELAGLALFVAGTILLVRKSRREQASAASNAAPETAPSR